MTYDAWKTRTPDDGIEPDDEREPDDGSVWFTIDPTDEHTAQHDNLTALANELGIQREPYETDGELRDRVMQHLRSWR